MEEVNKVIAAVSETKFEKGTFHWVDITSITDPHNFYIRPRKFNDFLKTVESTEPKIRVTTINKKELIVFNWGYSCGVKKYLRGLITYVNENNMTCDILTIDYGHTEKRVPIEHIWKCINTLSKVPSLSSICQLSNCYPIHNETDFRGFTSVSIKAFKSYVANEPARMHVLGMIGYKLVVNLVNSKPEDIATLMAIRTLTTIGERKDPFQWTPTVIRRGVEFKFKEIEVDQTLHVRMLSGKSLEEFHVASVSDYKKHLKEIVAITYYARREFVLFDYDIVLGAPLCVKNDEKDIYERAFIKKVNMDEKKVTVQLVDWGKDEDYPFDKLKYIASIITRTPVLAIFCSAKGSKFWGDDLNTFLTPGFEFLITIKRLGYKFECPNTVEISPLDEYYGGASAMLEEVEKSPLDERCEEAGVVLFEIKTSSLDEGDTASLDEDEMSPLDERNEGAAALVDDVEISPLDERNEEATACLDEVEISTLDERNEKVKALQGEVETSTLDEQHEEAVSLLNKVEISPLDESYEGASALLDET